MRLGHVSLDGTKVRANASKHKAMSYSRLLSKERALEQEIGRWFAEAEREDSTEDEAYGPDDDGYSLPPELRESQKRLQTIRAAKARLEAEARARAEREGKDVAQATPSERAQTNFTDPGSRIMHTPDGFQQCYNAQAAVDAESQVHWWPARSPRHHPTCSGCAPCWSTSWRSMVTRPQRSLPMPAMPPSLTSLPLLKPTSTPSSPCAATVATSPQTL